LAKYICCPKESDNPKDLMLNIYMKGLLKNSNFKNQSKFSICHYSIIAATWYLRNKKGEKSIVESDRKLAYDNDTSKNKKIEREVMLNLAVLQV